MTNKRVNKIVDLYKKIIISADEEDDDDAVEFGGLSFEDLDDPPVKQEPAAQPQGQKETPIGKTEKELSDKDTEGMGGFFENLGDEVEADIAKGDEPVVDTVSIKDNILPGKELSPIPEENLRKYLPAPKEEEEVEEVKSEDVNLPDEMMGEEITIHGIKVGAGGHAVFKRCPVCNERNRPIYLMECRKCKKINASVKKYIKKEKDRGKWALDINKAIYVVAGEKKLDPSIVRIIYNTDGITPITNEHIEKDEFYGRERQMEDTLWYRLNVERDPETKQVVYNNLGNPIKLEEKDAPFVSSKALMDVLHISNFEALMNLVDGYNMEFIAPLFGGEEIEGRERAKYGWIAPAIAYEYGAAKKGKKPSLDRDYWKRNEEEAANKESSTKKIDAALAKQYVQFLSGAPEIDKEGKAKKLKVNLPAEGWRKHRTSATSAKFNRHFPQGEAGIIIYEKPNDETKKKEWFSLLYITSSLKTEIIRVLKKEFKLNNMSTNKFFNLVREYTSEVGPESDVLGKSGAELTIWRKSVIRPALQERIEQVVEGYYPERKRFDLEMRLLSVLDNIKEEEAANQYIMEKVGLYEKNLPQRRFVKALNKIRLLTEEARVARKEYKNSEGEEAEAAKEKEKEALSKIQKLEENSGKAHGELEKKYGKVLDNFITWREEQKEKVIMHNGFLKALHLDLNKVQDKIDSFNKEELTLDDLLVSLQEGDDAEDSLTDENPNVLKRQKDFEEEHFDIMPTIDKLSSKKISLIKLADEEDDDEVAGPPDSDDIFGPPRMTGVEVKERSMEELAKTLKPQDDGWVPKEYSEPKELEPEEKRECPYCKSSIGKTSKWCKPCGFPSEENRELIVVSYTSKFPVEKKIWEGGRPKTIEFFRRAPKVFLIGIKVDDEGNAIVDSLGTALKPTIRQISGPSKKASVKVPVSRGVMRKARELQNLYKDKLDGEELLKWKLDNYKYEKEYVRLFPYAVELVKKKRAKGEKLKPIEMKILNSDGPWESESTERWIFTSPPSAVPKSEKDIDDPDIAEKMEKKKERMVAAAVNFVDHGISSGEFKVDRYKEMVKVKEMTVSESAKESGYSHPHNTDDFVPANDGQKLANRFDIAYKIFIKS